MCRQADRGGPIAALKCAATVLGGNYAKGVDSRFMSNTYFLVPPASESPRLRFWHWYSFGDTDYGKVQLRTTDNTTWKDISDTYSKTSSGVWTYPYIDLSQYAAKTVQIAFYFHSYCPNVFCYVSSGWYIDDVMIAVGTVTCTDNDGDGYGNPASLACTYPEADCDDNDPTINPGVKTDIYGDSIDNDCDGEIDEDPPFCSVKIIPDEFFVGLSLLPRLKIIRIIGVGPDFASQGNIVFSSDDVIALTSKVISNTEISALVYIAPRAKTGSFDVTVGECVGKNAFEIKKWWWQ